MAEWWQTTLDILMWVLRKDFSLIVRQVSKATRLIIMAYEACAVLQDANRAH